METPSTAAVDAQCEVSAEAPDFDTKYAVKNMTVIRKLEHAFYHLFSNGSSSKLWEKEKLDSFFYTFAKPFFMSVFSGSFCLTDTRPLGSHPVIESQSDWTRTICVRSSQLAQLEWMQIFRKHFKRLASICDI